MEGASDSTHKDMFNQASSFSQCGPNSQPKKCRRQTPPRLHYWWWAALASRPLPRSNDLVGVDRKNSVQDFSASSARGSSAGAWRRDSVVSSMACPVVRAWIFCIIATSIGFLASKSAYALASPRLCLSAALSSSSSLSSWSSSSSSVSTSLRLGAALRRLALRDRTRRRSSASSSLSSSDPDASNSSSAYPPEQHTRHGRGGGHASTAHCGVALARPHQQHVQHGQHAGLPRHHLGC